MQEQARVQERALAELAVAAHLVHDANQLMEAAQVGLQKAKEEKAEKMRLAAELDAAGLGDPSPN